MSFVGIERYDMRMKKSLKTAGIGVLVAIVASAIPMWASAAVQAPTATAKVSFTFDDGFASTLTQAAPTLAKYGLTGTSYAVSGCIGMTTAPNTCHADTNGVYMTWANLATLQNTYGWEIASHTATHPYLASSDASDGQPNVLTLAQVAQELQASKAAFASHGFDASDFATPYGDYTPEVLAEVAKHYESHRGFADTGYNVHPYNDFLLRDQQVQAGVSVATVKGYIDQAIATKTWLVLSFHDIKVNASKNPDDYEYNTADLDQIAAYAKSKINAGQLTSTNIDRGLVNSDVNLLANGSFNNGIADGWSTDVPASIVADSGNNGSYPDPAKSIKLTATSRNAHLFSPRVSVDNSVTYLIKNFVNVKNITSGELGFYIDEYDIGGNWVSGQYKAAERTKFVENINFSYKPSSTMVKSARLQVIVTANSGISAFVDNIKWFPVNAATVATNLLPNGSFDTGLTGGWTTDSAATITADSTNNGSPQNAVNSIKTVSSTRNTHLNSPKVVVTNTKSYSINNYVKINQLTTGEVGFYIDEYNASGAWISGQYKTGIRGVGSTNVGFTYTPSSALVTSASLQVITTANSGITAYYDDVVWTAN